VYAVTSPTAGDGKTSLSLSLAMSFAASGARTVLVDFDLIGHGMSGRFRAAPVHSLGTALLGGSLNGCVTQTQIPGLSLLPAGRDDGRSVSRIPRENVDRVLAELKQQFDIVIIDTGPILGSLEANLAAAAADGVLLVVGRGQQQSHVQSALSHLLTLHANILGLVFNRAGATDFNRSTSSSSFRSLNSTELDRARPLVSSPETEGFDPLPRSVANDLTRSRQD
jgi:capsular exopolysaccharide synthesis family protein